MGLTEDQLNELILIILLVILCIWNIPLSPQEDHVIAYELCKLNSVDIFINLLRIA